MGAVLRRRSITAAALGLSVLTGTANCTYGEGLGVSGWVIDDNRCANSIILVTLAAFSIFCAVKSDKPFVNIAVPVIAAVVLIANGTMTCYMSIFVIFVSALQCSCCSRRKYADVISTGLR